MDPIDLDRQLELAKRAAQTASGVLERHFALMDLMELQYKHRDRPGMLEAALGTARSMVAIAPQVREAMRRKYGRGGATGVRHPGFERLVIVLEKQGQLEEALSFSIEARRQRWHGDWTERIERLRAKLEKAGRTATKPTRVK
ncbi:MULTISPECIES: hypothetical protein [unclassified Meiothermus]|uniref:hypothetical protein n=1 Tax=unclassified Meiothermus TaxID=370471 RepID=UPI000D7C45DE|nr:MULTISPECIES: hypothetical protein [unclassified Meiothermus]PZA07763.1 hypothetical protein DNA98_05505 [Meiothermus sp. Pnk-1]RYM38937.1 hypothetical protein EWH23_04190 [Meiothermus sp. PNK-Is4]